MKSISAIVCSALAIVMTMSGCMMGHKDTITQVSTYEALEMGAYDGSTPLKELVRYGDFGIGVMQELNGEFIVYNGQAYVCKQNGSVSIADLNTPVPYGMIVPFKTDFSMDIATATKKPDFEKRLLEFLPPNNQLIAVMVYGTFSQLKIRSLSKQNPPYEPLSDIEKGQAVFDYRDITGTLVGFCDPGYLKGIQQRGFQFYFLSADKKSGGHVMDFAISKAMVKVDLCNRLLLIVPGEGTSFSKLKFK